MTALTDTRLCPSEVGRGIRMQRTAMGPLIVGALENPDVLEIMLNPDGSLWVDRLSYGRALLCEDFPATAGERIIRLVADRQRRRETAKT